MLTLIETSTPETTMAKQPSLNLEELSGKALEELIQKAQALKQERKAEKIQELRTRWQTEAEEEGIPLSDIFPPAREAPKPRQKANGEKTAPTVRFRFPDDTTWSGRGRIPLGARSFLKNAGAPVKTDGFFEDKEAGKAALEKFTVSE